MTLAEGLQLSDSEGMAAPEAQKRERSRFDGSAPFTLLTIATYPSVSTSGEDAVIASSLANSTTTLWTPGFADPVSVASTLTQTTG